MPTTDWTPITSVPCDRDVQLSVIERDEVHALVFPCRRAGAGWVNASNRRPVLVEPTHWRLWSVEQD